MMCLPFTYIKDENSQLLSNIMEFVLLECVYTYYPFFLSFYLARF